MGALSLDHEPVTGIPMGKLGMWVFLTTEIMFFAGFFTLFMIMDQSNPGLFAESSQLLDWRLAALNTVILICSSLTMALAILNLERNNVKLFRTFMAITFLCACGFLVVKAIEYGGKFSHGIYPSENVFFGVYFLMTGFHGIHVIAGMIPIAWMWLRSYSKKGYHRADRVEVLGLYWHFVDLVWIFLFPVFYLLYNENLQWVPQAIGAH